MKSVSPFYLVRNADYEAMSLVAAARIEAQLRRKSNSLLILARGRTPVPHGLNPVVTY